MVTNIVETVRKGFLSTACSQLSKHILRALGVIVPSPICSARYSRSFLGVLDLVEPEDFFEDLCGVSCNKENESSFRELTI
jgi:hypothetical protein